MLVLHQTLGLSKSPCMSGKHNSLQPTSRCDGVTASSSSCEDTYVNGREFSVASTCVTAVNNSSWKA